MSKRHQKTFEAIFKTPILPNVRWNDIESLFEYLGGTISEGRGSRVRVELNGVKAVFHRPHPQPVTDKGSLVSVRKFLKNAGVTYDEI